MSVILKKPLESNSSSQIYFHFFVESCELIAENIIHDGILDYMLSKLCELR
jgi:hypothetical protein